MNMRACLAAAAVLLSACHAQAPAAAHPTPPSVSATPPATLKPVSAATVAPIRAAVVVTRIAPAPSAAPVATQTPDVSSTPAGPVSVQLTKGGCCVQPFFSPDGSQVLFLDRPGPTAQVGIYGVRVDQPLSQPTLVTERLGPFSRDLSHNALLLNGQTFVERKNGDAWRIDNGGRAVSFSPDAKRVLWSVSSESGGFDRRRTDIWLANIDGANARLIATRYGGGALAWFDDSRRLLIGGRPAVGDEAPTLSVLDLQSGAIRDLVRIERLRGALLAPGGERLLFFVAQARTAGIGGAYMLNLNEADPRPFKLDFFGAYRWRDATRLLYIPLTADNKNVNNELWQFDVTTMTSTRLIGSDATVPLKIGNGDWDISPDGANMVWLNARDRNIWITRLP